MDTRFAACDQKGEIEAHCAHHCTSVIKEYMRCQKRINSYDDWDYRDLQTECDWKQMRTHDKAQKPLPKQTLVEQLKAAAHCTPQFFDLKHCIDHCTAPKLFQQLK